MFDYHVHSLFSADSKMKLTEACDAAIEAGVKEIAFTEHIDYFYPNCDLIFDFDYEDYAKAIDEVQEQYKNKLTVLKAVEIGIHPFKHKENSMFTKANYFDFIIGSVHLADDQDLHNGDFFKGKNVNEAVENYFLTINQYVKEFSDFNVLGHLTLIKRYLHFVNAHWTEVNWRNYNEIIEDTFKALIESERGIEINMSGYRYRIDCALPDLPLIKLYKQCGGEVITVGTDAHSKHFVGKHLDLGYDLLRQAGFKYVTTFRERKPKFVLLSDL
ncbi:histidinol-phosphatase HisJ family protein [Anaerobacillus isosaccharinicus]|uniref:Histidinol-phosphatase n=1 Tax=Anaerobacillus isosaccharinicus TaxID=1532552 RepID=A0A1S2L0M4_9BACI|nr:histidinol-phosphatase HisJ family protein [Anaerobacillus isosaccharinicus]MBA5584293.1 histidinol-phosphatase HisJ family protein [Anaerobacillus isosaccharinicus]QOY37307.1 histidinol-phosphatase HisJ family protein [Anaerobacillus isosaccharinicus]